MTQDKARTKELLSKKYKSEAEIEELIRLNEALVHAILKNYNMYGNEDALSYGLEGLYKAINEFNPDLGYQFSTLAYVVVRNRIGQYARMCKKEFKIDVVSYDVYIKNAKEATNNKPTVYDLLQSSFNTHNQAMQKDNVTNIKRAIKQLYNRASGKEKDILKCWITSDFSMIQEEIMVKANSSQAHVSRCLRKFKKDLKIKLEAIL